MPDHRLPYQCKEHPRCSYGSARRNNLERHMRTMHRPEESFCCNEKFLTKFEFVEHTQQEHQSGEYPCNFEGCNVVCTRRALLYRHERVHTGEKPHHCTECEYRSSSRSNLQRHLLSVHGVSLPESSRKRRESDSPFMLPVSTRHCAREDNVEAEDISFSMESANKRYSEAQLDVLDLSYCSVSPECDVVAASVVADEPNESEMRLVPTPPLSDASSSENSTSQRSCVLPCPDCGHTYGSTMELSSHRYEKHEFGRFDAALALLLLTASC
ncbi:zinc finger protein 467-like [Ornithodoros turicata]|uniref:zinc finger protein 467-like n=1 Tax=Ornithodoros turicata TaxID=34597 RepID=UPI00313867EA